MKTIRSFSLITLAVVLLLSGVSAQATPRFVQRTKDAVSTAVTYGKNTASNAISAVRNADYRAAANNALAAVQAKATKRNLVIVGAAAAVVAAASYLYANGVFGKLAAKATK